MKKVGTRTLLKLSLLDVVVLLYHVYRGSQVEEVGFEDCERTMEEIVKQLNRKTVYINKEVVESALWSTNLMNEIGKFWEPTDLEFNDFVERLVSLESAPIRFDDFFNLLIIKESKKSV